MNFYDRFIVSGGSRVQLSRVDAADTAGYKSKEQAKAPLEKNIERLNDLQLLLYAENRRAVLVVLQGMDTAGKDGTIRHVMTGLNPQSCRVASFKTPTPEEQAHDFLWRIHRHVPAKGEIGIFNRSHYEDVLIVRVHDLVPRNVWSNRYEEINRFEKTLADNDVVILKFFLHISKAEQLRRLKARLDDPAKQWKISPDDFKERPYWAHYHAAYEELLRRCSPPWAPWFIIPADHKWIRNLAVSAILGEALGRLKMKYPKPKFDLSRIKVK